MKKAKWTLPTPDEALSEWIELKTGKNKIEARMEALKKIIEPYLELLPEKSCLHNGWEFKIVWTVDKESFSLKAAKEKIDGRVLAPYISLSTFSQIRTTFKGIDTE